MLNNVVQSMWGICIDLTPVGIRNREVLSIKKTFPYYEVQSFFKLCELEREKNKDLEICDTIIERYMLESTWGIKGK